jgi:biopolymer transport protein ExbD
LSYSRAKQKRKVAKSPVYYTNDAYEELPARERCQIGKKPVNWGTLHKSVSLAVLLLVFVLLLIFYAMPHKTSKGFFVGLAPTRCEDRGDRLVVLSITNRKAIFLNDEQEEWNTLSSRLSEIYKERVYRVLYLSADNDVTFQTVADAIDIVRNTNLTPSIRREIAAKGARITVKLITPAAINASCSPPVVAEGSPHACDRW